MDHRLRAGRGDGVPKRRGVERVGRHGLGALGAQPLELVRASGDIADHLVALLEQRGSSCAADHAGGAGERRPSRAR